jgi:peroxiredoxin
VLEPGSIAPEFSLKDVEGERTSLRANLKLGPVLVTFFKISCATCQLTLPFLGRLEGSLRVLGISEDDADSTREFLDYFKITFPVLIDPASDRYAVSAAYRLEFVPSTFLIEKDGKISWSLNGFHKADLEALAARSWKPARPMPSLTGTALKWQATTPRP